MDVASAVDRDLDEFLRGLGVGFGEGDAEFLRYCASGGPQWQAFLAEYGASWDGSAELWPTFREWFLHHAQQRGFAAPAAEFLAEVDGRADRVEAFAEYGVTVGRGAGAPAGRVTAGAEPPAEPDLAESANPADCADSADSADSGRAGSAPPGGYDEQAWVEFLGEYGRRWNGSDGGWPAFRVMFLLRAGECGLGIPATAFVEYVERQPDRRAVFDLYGIELPPAVQQPGRPAPVRRRDAARATTGPQLARARQLMLRGAARQPRVRSSSRRRAA